MGLELVLLLQRLASGTDPFGERVADALELGKIGDARDCMSGRDPGVERNSLKGLSREARELVFEAADLSPQLNAREALIAPRPQCRQGFSIEQIWHGPEIECRSRRFRGSLAVCYDEKEQWSGDFGSAMPRSPHKRSRAPRRPRPGERP